MIIEQLLKEWIESGAKWGSDPIDPFRFSTSTRAGRDWWSLQPLKRPTVPVSREPKASANPIDAFLLDKLEKAGLKPNPPADKRLGPPKTLNDYFPFAPPQTKEEWEKRRRFVKEQVLVATGLWPLPEKTPLLSLARSVRSRSLLLAAFLRYASMAARGSRIASWTWPLRNHVSELKASGWIFSAAGRADRSRYAKDLVSDRGLRVIAKLFLPTVLVSLLVPAVVGWALIGGWYGFVSGLVWGGAVRIFLLHHVTWSINSICHFWGRRRFDSRDESRNVWWLSWLSCAPIGIRSWQTE